MKELNFEQMALMQGGVNCEKAAYATITICMFNAAMVIGLLTCGAAFGGYMYLCG